MKNHYRPWSDEDDSYMTEEYPHTPVETLAMALKRTVRSVEQRASLLGLKKNLTRYEIYEDGKLLADGTAEELAKELYVSIDAIYNYIYQNDKANRTYGARADL